MKISVDVQGVDACIRRLRQLEDQGTEGMAAALYQEAEDIMTRSKRDFVPVDTGTLRATGHVEEPVIRGSEVLVTLGFGGPAAPYAIVVHENPLASHKVGQYKYLERPALEAVRGMGNRLADRIRKMFR